MTSGDFVQPHSSGQERQLCEPLAGRSLEIAFGFYFPEGQVRRVDPSDPEEGTIIAPERCTGEEGW